MEDPENYDDEANISQLKDVDKEEEKDKTPSFVIPGFASFDDFLQEAFDKIRSGIKAANNLPSGKNYSYYSCFPSFNNAKSKDISKMLTAMQNVIKTAGGSGNIESRDIEEKFELLQETNDILIDRANICMDEESGILRNPEVELIVSQMSKKVNSSWNAKTPQAVTEIADDSQNVRLLAGKYVHRPQLMFKDKIDNSSKLWQPRITEKPNSLKPLAIYLEEDENGEAFNHPYEFELNKFEPPECQLNETVPIKYKSLDDSRFIMVDKASDIKNILEDLKKCTEIAVDLEHHSYRTFQGITCLMQISTQDTDYIIDTLTLRSELYQLNEIFTNPSILKIFHGANSDILWLQRDLSLYVVNMFDTHQAAKQLNLPYLSLAYLLKQYCNVDPNKHFQLADWRIRPLPDELITYAREDTHYLLYIKDILKNELIQLSNGQSNILKAVYDKSTDICKRTYVKPVWTEENCMNMYKRSQKAFNNKQMYAFKELHHWRDITARQEDDSTGYVLPNHMLLNIAETLPREMQGILACCNPIPPLVRQNVLKLHKIILEAREQPLIKSILKQDFRPRLAQQNHVVNSAAWFLSSHDVPREEEIRADLPCLLNKTNLWQSFEKNATVKHTVTIFDANNTNEKEDDDGKKLIFVSPFKRYMYGVPIIAEQEAKDREKLQEKEKEKQLTREIVNETLDVNDIAESKKRVYEHFKQTNKEVQNSSKKKSKQLILGKMNGKKKKKSSNIVHKVKSEESNANFSTPTPSLNTRITHIPKKAKLENNKAMEEVKMRQIQKDKDFKMINLLRPRKKGEKKTNIKQLQKQGMLPSDKFDYKSVDFNSFQGGSMTNNSREAQFQQPKRKKKRRQLKKQNLSI